MGGKTASIVIGVVLGSMTKTRLIHSFSYSGKAVTQLQMQPAGTTKLSASLQTHAHTSGTEIEQKKPVSVAEMTVEDKLAMAAARRQQMEIEKTQTAKEIQQVADSSSGTDQSKKRYAGANIQSPGINQAGS